MNDFSFTSSDLINGKLTIQGAIVGGFAIEDGSGNLVMPSQKSITNGVEVDFSRFNVQGTWRVRFFRGDPGRNTTGGISPSEAMIYAMVFG